MSEDQFFQFKPQFRCGLFIDGNYMLNISRVLNIKIDMEALFNQLTKSMFRYRAYWYSALEASIDRNNNAYRFLDRLKYIPRTKVYAGRMTKRSQGHFESALRTDAGVALSVGMLELAKSGQVEYIILIAADPEYVPAIRAVQRAGVIVRVVHAEFLGDLNPHPDLLKAADERVGLDAADFHDHEYVSDYEMETDDEDIEDIEEIEEELDDEFLEDDDDDDDVEIEVEATEVE